MNKTERTAEAKALRHAILARAAAARRMGRLGDTEWRESQDQSGIDQLRDLLTF